MDWKFVVKRKLSLLFDELITQGQIKKVMKERLDADFGFDNYRAIEWRVSYTVEELEETKKTFREIYEEQGPVYFNNLMNEWKNYLKSLENVSEEISKNNYSGSKDAELKEDLNKLKEAYKNLSTSLYAPIVIESLCDEVIKEELKKKEPDKIDEYFSTLTSSDKENEGIKELKSITQLAIEFQKGEDISKEVKEHIEEFGWINTRGFFGEAWTEEEVLERIESMEKGLQKRLEELREHPEEVRKDTQKILDKLESDEEFRKFIEVTKDYVHYRTERMDAFVKAGFLARNLFGEIAERIGIELEDLWYLLSVEIKKALDGKDFSEVIKERREGFGFIKEGEKITVLSGRKLEDYKENMEGQNDNFEEIRGSMASPGKVTGTVKVVSGKDELGKVKKGDILVTSMTTPDFIVAMEKASAFVTDEGGILCHAAIVSREMKKPCIIGTNIATKALKDGDVVEVDANHGVVNKI